MAIDSASMQQYIYNPSLIQKEIYDLIGVTNGGNYTVSNPTNPFSLLIEATAITASSAVLESNAIIRKKYPSLAKKNEDIFHHFFDDILPNLFSIPAEAYFDFFIPVINIRNNGYKPEGANYWEVTIPTNTRVSVLDIPFTILNDIVVKLYENGETFVEQQLNPDNLIAYDDAGVLPSGIMNTGQTTPVLFFRTKVKQVEVNVITKNIVVAEGVNVEVNIADRYHYSNVYVKKSGNATFTKIRKTHSDDYINPNLPMCFITLYDKKILYRIPDTYLIEGVVNGILKIEVITTKGEITSPIHQINTDQYKVMLGDVNKSKSTIVSKQMAIIARAPYPVNGGLNSIEFNTLRDQIVEQGFITSNLPITDKQISAAGDLQGYKIIKNLDVLTNREYIALKSLPNSSSDFIYAKQDVLFNTVKLKLSELNNHKNVKVNGGLVNIKSGTVFEYDNGIITPLDDVRREAIGKLSKVNLVSHLQENTYFYTPYYYFIRNTGLITTTDVYDLDKPVLNNYRIIIKNNNIDSSVNVVQYAINKELDGYRLYFRITGNAKFNSLNSSMLYLEAKVPMYGGKSYATVQCEYDPDTQQYSIPILTEFLIDEEGYLVMTNGMATGSKRLAMDLDILLYTMSADPALTDTSGFLVTEVTHNNVVVLTKEEFKVTIGTHLTNIYTNSYITFGVDKYKTYEEDYPLVHKENVYDIDPVSGTAFSCNLAENEEEHSLEFNIRARKGDIVKDEEGNTVYVYRKGEVMRNDIGQPIIDYEGAAEYYVDILMLEIEFALANTADYKSELSNTLSVLKQYITQDVPGINNMLLENTKVVYKSYKSSKPLYSKSNASLIKMPFIVTPTVTLYFVNTTAISENILDTYKTTIGNIINKYLDNTVIKIGDIKNEIMNTVSSNITSVRIDNLDPNNSEVITLTTDTQKLTLGKTLSINLNNEFVVKYNIQVIPIYI